jgi:pimeloyl-[acyl-carrier protein] methyl ester esterase
MRSRIRSIEREGTDISEPAPHPTLVLLPGMDGSGLLFQPFIEALGVVGEFDVRTIAYPEREPLGYAALTDLASAALPAGPLVLLGESFSGPIALALAARCADRVQGVILCCSFVRNPRPGWPWLLPLLRRAPMPAPPPALISRALLGRHTTAPLQAQLAQALAGVTPDVLRARLVAVGSVDASAALSALRAPLLYLRANEDRLVPASALSWVQQLRPDVSVATFEAPHALLQACPAQAAAAVRAFSSMSLKAAARAATSVPPLPPGCPARSPPAASPAASGASTRSTDRAASRGASGL